MPNASPPSASTDHPTSSAASDDIRMSQSSSPATKPPHQAVPSTKDSPTPHPPPSSASAVDPSLANSKLASLLADALSQVESLKSSLNDARKRSAYFESLSKSLESVKSPSSNAPSEAANFKIAELEKRVYEAEVRRDQEIARRLALVDQWKALSKYLDRVEGASKDARVRMDRIADSGLGSGDGVFVTLHVPAIDDVPHEERTYYYDGSSSKSRKTRPRSDSIDTYPPPPKRSRVDKHGTYQQYAIDPAHFEADRAHLPHHMYIPSAITTISPNSPYATHPPPPPTGNQHHSSRPSPSHTSASQIPSSQHVVHHHQPVSHPQQIQTISSSNSVPAVSQSNHSTHSRSQSHINHSSRTHRLSSPSHNRSRSRSRSGSSLEEMLIQATTGDSPQAQVSASNAYSLKPNNATSRSRSHSNMSARLVEHPSGHPPPLSSQAMFGSHSHSHPQHQHQQFSHPSHLVGSRSSLHSPISHHPPRHPSDSPPISRRERDHSEGRGTLVPDGSLDHIQARSHVHSHQHGPGMDVREIQERDRERETDHRDHLRDREGREYSQHPSQHRQYQHTFAPVQTGAPVRKSRWNASLPSVAQEDTSPAGIPRTATLPSLSGHSLPGSSSSFAPNSSIQSPKSSQTLANPLDPTQPFTPYPATNASGQRICRQCGQAGRYKDGKCVEKWGPGPMGPGTVCDRCRKKMKRVEKRGAAERERAALQAQQAVQGRTGLTKADTLLIGPGGGEARLTVHGSFSKSAAASRGGSRAGSIVNGASRRSSPIGGKGNMTPARMVQPPPSSSLSTRKPMTSGSSGSQRSGSGGSPRSARSMDMDADGEPDDDFDGHDSQHEEGDGEIDELEDMTKAEEEVDGELADLVGDTESKVVSQRHVEKDCKKPGGSGVISNRSQFNIDIAVSQLAGMDDDTTADSPRARKIKRSRSGSAEDAGAGVEVEEDAEADLLEAVDAAEANSDD